MPRSRICKKRRRSAKWRSTRATTLLPRSISNWPRKLSSIAQPFPPRTATKRCRASSATAPYEPPARDQPLADKSLHQLEALANGSRNRVIQSSWHGAAGSLLMDQKKYPDAIAQLEEDQDNPFTMELLVQAYYQTAQTDKLHEAEAKLRGTNVPTMEQALVVPAARAKRPVI